MTDKFKRYFSVDFYHFRQPDDRIFHFGVSRLEAGEKSSGEHDSKVVTQMIT